MPGRIDGVPSNISVLIMRLCIRSSSCQQQWRGERWTGLLREKDSEWDPLAAQSALCYIILDTLNELLHFQGITPRFQAHLPERSPQFSRSHTAACRADMSCIRSHRVVPEVGLDHREKKEKLSQSPELSRISSWILKLVFWQHNTDWIKTDLSHHGEVFILYHWELWTSSVR